MAIFLLHFNILFYFCFFQLKFLVQLKQSLIVLVNNNTGIKLI